MLRKVTTLALLFVFVSTMAILPLTAQANQRAAGHVAVPITSAAGATAKLPDMASAEPFTGNFFVERFTIINNKLWVLGTISGTTQSGKSFVATGAKAEVENMRSVTLNASAVANAPEGFQLAQAACPILQIDIGPIEIDLLGLVIELPQGLELNIIAEPGPGNLLGNLLCAIANLLNPGIPTLPGLLQQLVNLLNQILQALSALGVVGV